MSFSLPKLYIEHTRVWTSCCSLWPPTISVAFGSYSAAADAIGHMHSSMYDSTIQQRRVTDRGLACALDVGGCHPGILHLFSMLK